MPQTLIAYRQQRQAHWDAIAARGSATSAAGGYYHRRISRIFRHLVAPGQRVLEIGCGPGDLLAELAPSFGLGIDVSHEMIYRARQSHRGANLRFVQADGHALPLDASAAFDVILLQDLLNDVYDVQALLEQVASVCHPRTRIILNYFSRLWLPALNAARSGGLATPLLEQNWLATEDVTNLLDLAGLESIRHRREILWPIRTPGVDALFNRILVKLPGLKQLALTNVLVARRPRPAVAKGAAPLVSVIIPARNEAGNIDAIFQRVPEMGGGTELVFVEGGSSDDTFGAIERAIAAHPHRRARLLRQRGRGKGDAVRLGFAEAAGEVLMILDADLTVPPEALPRFYDALISGKGEFINGVRLVYPMERQSMRFLNQVANKLFGWAFSWLLDQPVKDTLCGTKALLKRDYQRIAAERSYFGDFDPFGDFDLLFGAARQNLKIVDMPVRYSERTYGATNISRFSHGWLLLRMTWLAAWRIKFV